MWCKAETQRADKDQNHHHRLGIVILFTRVWSSAVHVGATRHEQHHALAASDPKPASLAMKELRRVFRRREERSIYVGFRLSPPQSKLALILQRAAASSTISAVFTLFGIGVQICGVH